jgi:hypothetical protein|tara:strand:- start:481 stop:612 length:132 start_codon:yes stop_codon:yes gene_type:complete
MRSLFRWHRKKVFRPIKRKFGLNGYQMSWIAFGKGFIIGALIL